MSNGYSDQRPAHVLETVFVLIGKSREKKNRLAGSTHSLIIIYVIESVFFLISFRFNGFSWHLHNANEIQPDQRVRIKGMQKLVIIIVYATDMNPLLLRCDYRGKNNKQKLGISDCFPLSLKSSIYISKCFHCTVSHSLSLSFAVRYLNHSGTRHVYHLFFCFDRYKVQFPILWNSSHPFKLRGGSSFWKAFATNWTWVFVMIYFDASWLPMIRRYYFGNQQ